MRLFSFGYGIEKSLTEWPYLNDHLNKIFIALLVAISLTPIFFHNRFLPSPQASELGIMLFSTTLVAFGLIQMRQRIGLFLALLGLEMWIWLVQQWWQGAGASTFWLLPVILATQLIGLCSSLFLTLATLVILWWPSLFALPSTEPAERIVVMIVLFVFSASSWTTQAHISQLIDTLTAQYNRMLRELETAREHRLAVKQVNQDLVDAYVQLRKLNEMLKASRLDAEAARRSKEDFVANVSHELRTPLNMIIGLSEMVLTAPESYSVHLPPSLISDMSVIPRNSQHLSQLINDVLDLSQTEAGKLPLYRDWIVASEIVDEAIVVITPLYQARGLYLRKLVPPDLPLIYCDRVRVRQVLLNLLSNAGRYTEEGGVTVHVTAEDNLLRFDISDTGPGLSAEEQSRIFEPFQRAHGNHTLANPGSGLGLSICRQFVNLHDGKMWIESAVGRGSTFSFQLPLPAQALSFSNAERWVNVYSAQDPHQKLSSESLPQTKKRLVILDPTQLLSRRLQAEWPEADIIVTKDLETLRAEVAQWQPDILLVNDIRVMQDRHFIRHALTLPDRLPILSCYIPGREEAWKNLNIVDYMIKPVMRSTLVENVAKHVSNGATILIAEDDLDTALLTRRQLTSANCAYRIITVKTGEDALTTLRTREIDLVCLDVNLPDIDGYQILQEKNEDSKIREIPVMIISARDPTGDPVVAGRLRVETAGGLSIRDLTHCTRAMEWAFSV